MLPERPTAIAALLASIVFLVLPIAPALAGPAVEEKTPAPGDTASDFSLPYATADTIAFQGPRLSEVLRESGPILLAFYPADWSPGCTKEVCMFRDSFADLDRLGLTVWGISEDTVFSHRAWAAHHGLPFRLLSDHKHEVAAAYGVMDTESGFARRSVFVVGRDGKIAYADPEYSVADGSDFEALKAAVAGMR